MMDQLTAMRVLAGKVMPDLRTISGSDGSAMVTVLLQLAQKVTIGP